MGMTKNEILKILDEIPDEQADEEIAILVLDGNDENWNTEYIALNTYDSGFDLEIRLEEGLTVLSD